MDLTDFLLARIAEDERRYSADPSEYGYGHGFRMAECEAKRRIVEWHRNWPVLFEGEPEFRRVDDPSRVTFRLTQQVAWLTQQEYVARFGTEPPSAPILLMLAQPYAGHPDYKRAWRP